MKKNWRYGKHVKEMNTEKRFVPGSGWDEEHDHKIFMMQKKHHCAFEMIREYGSILKVTDLIQKWAVKGI